jgi:hypothetical protein
MPNPLTPYPENSGERTDLVVAAIVDNPMVFEYVGRLADAISLATPTDQVFNQPCPKPSRRDHGGRTSGEPSGSSPPSTGQRVRPCGWATTCNG